MQLQNKQNTSVVVRCRHQRSSQDSDEHAVNPFLIISVQMCVLQTIKLLDGHVLNVNMKYLAVFFVYHSV